MVYYLYVCTYKCPSCRSRFYVVNLRLERIPCKRCGQLARYLGKEKVLVESYEEYAELVKERVYEASPLPSSAQASRPRGEGLGSGGQAR